MPTTWPAFGQSLPLWDAVYAQNVGLAQKLLASPAGIETVNRPHGLWQETSVHVAVRRGHAKLLTHLLFSSGDPNARSVNGTTPLHIAVMQGRRDLVESLLLAGANPLLRNMQGKNAIRLARDSDLPAIASMLQRHADSSRALASIDR